MKHIMTNAEMTKHMTKLRKIPQPFRINITLNPKAVNKKIYDPMRLREFHANLNDAQRKKVTAELEALLKEGIIKKYVVAFDVPFDFKMCKTVIDLVKKNRKKNA